MVLNSQSLYARLKPWLKAFERRAPFREQMAAQIPEALPEVIVFGLGRYGGKLMQRLHNQNIITLGVDFDPEAVRHARHRGLHARFGMPKMPNSPSACPSPVRAGWSAP